MNNVYFCHKSILMRLTILLVMFTGFLMAQPSWNALPSIPGNEDGQRFDDVFFLNENLGWAANGYYASVLKTTDGGVTWTEQLSNGSQGTNYYFRNIEFLNENIGFLGTLNNVFLKTTDGGANWSPVTNIAMPTAAICGLDAVGSSTVYGCGAYFSPAYIIKSSDSGVTWQYIDMSNYATALVEIVFQNEMTGYAAGANANGGIVLKTTDGGESWAEIFNSMVPGEYVWKLQLLDEQHIFGALESVAPLPGKLIKSDNAGISWTLKTAPETIIQAVGFVSPLHGWMGGHTSGFMETVDGGETWTDLGAGSNLNRIFIINDQLAYASGTSIYKYDVPLSIGKGKERDRQPLTVQVVNPVKNKLDIQIDFVGTDHLVLGLYSAAGQYIGALGHDDISVAGRKSYSFDFPYAGGLYLIDMHTNTGRQSIKVVKQ